MATPSSSPVTSLPPLTIGAFVQEASALDSARGRRGPRRTVEARSSQTATTVESKVGVKAQESFKVLNIKFLQFQIESITEFNAKIKQMLETPLSALNPLELRPFLHKSEARVSQLQEALSIMQSAAQFRVSEQERSEQIAKMLEGDLFTTEALREHEGVVRLVEEVCSGPTLTELEIKYKHFEFLLEQFNKFKVNLEAEKAKINAHQSILDASTTGQIDFQKLETSVKSLLESRNKLLIRAKNLKGIIPQAYAQMNHLIQRYEETFGKIKMEESDPFFQRSAAINYRKPSDVYEQYETMHKQVQLLKGMVTDYENAWNSVNYVWTETKDKLRYLNFIVLNKRIPSRTLTGGREEAGPDAQSVVSFKWGVINPQTVSGSWWSSYWGSGSSPAASSTPVSAAPAGAV